MAEDLQSCWCVSTSHFFTVCLNQWKYWWVAIVSQLMSELVRTRLIYRLSEIHLLDNNHTQTTDNKRRLLPWTDTKPDAMMNDLAWADLYWHSSTMESKREQATFTLQPLVANCKLFNRKPNFSCLEGHLPGMIYTHFSFWHCERVTEMKYTIHVWIGKRRKELSFPAIQPPRINADKMPNRHYRIKHKYKQTVQLAPYTTCLVQDASTIPYMQIVNLTLYE